MESTQKTNLIRSFDASIVSMNEKTNVPSDRLTSNVRDGTSLQTISKASSIESFQPAPTSQIHIIPIEDDEPKTISTLRLAIIILHPALVNFFTSFTNGVITVGLPIIARSIELPRSLYLWPSSVFGLTSGAALLLAGSVADMIGAKKVELAGVMLLGVMTIACGLAANGIQLVVFRAIQGIAMAMHLPASVGIIAKAVPSGRARNVAFSCLGLSQPLGFSVGLALSGAMIDRVGWRAEFFLPAGATLFLGLTSFWALPSVPGSADNMPSVWTRLWLDIDWIGGGLASGGLAMIAYVLA